MVITTTERRRTKTPNSNGWAPIAKRGRDNGLWNEVSKSAAAMGRESFSDSLLADDAPQRVPYPRAKALFGRIGHE